MVDYPPTVMIKTDNFQRIWSLAVYTTIREGAILPEGPETPERKPTLTRDVCLTIEITGDAINQILNGDLHLLYPQRRGTDTYTKQFIKGTEEYIKANSGFDYTYPQRLFDREVCSRYCTPRCSNLCKFYNNGDFTEGECYTDQMKTIVENLEEFNRRLQAVTWDIQKDLISDVSVPCLQFIQLRRLYDNTYEIHLFWRSRDLFKAWQLNMVGIIRAIVRYIELYCLEDLRCVKVTDHITMAHIYESEWDDAMQVPVLAKWLVEDVYR